jgi:hypothetical protein
MDGNQYRVMVKSAEKRFTLAPWYVPNSEDAHGDWADPELLQRALWEYVQSGDRDIRLQHNTDIVAGQWVEAMVWPYEVTLPMHLPNTGETRDYTFPANTPFLGVIWEPWAWELVKQGKILGLSIGGTGRSVEADLDPEAMTEMPFAAMGA